MFKGGKCGRWILTGSGDSLARVPRGGGEGEVDVVFELQLCVLNFYTGLIYPTASCFPVSLFSFSSPLSSFFSFHFNFSRVTLKLTLNEAFQNYRYFYPFDRREKSFYILIFHVKINCKFVRSPSSVYLSPYISFRFFILERRVRIKDRFESLVK